MAGEGAVLIDENGREYMSPVPKGKVVNAVGAGDSMVAGFIAGYLEKRIRICIPHGDCIRKRERIFRTACDPG